MLSDLRSLIVDGSRDQSATPDSGQEAAAGDAPPEGIVADGAVAGLSPQPATPRARISAARKDLITGIQPGI
ncbi:hypothetical protein GCM10009780_63060 [Actinomadura alba]